MIPTIALLRERARRLAETGTEKEIRDVNRAIHAELRRLQRVNRRRARVGYLADNFLGGRTLETLRTAISIDRGYNPESWK